MINRTIDIIFEPSGLPVPTRDEVLFEAREIVQRSGWGVPLLERLRHVSNPYWREALTRILMERWREMVQNKDEQTYYYDMDGYMCYCWADAEYDFNRIIRNSTNEQVEEEKGKPTPNPSLWGGRKVESRKSKDRFAQREESLTPARTQIVNNYYIQTHNGPIITDCNVTIH